MRPSIAFSRARNPLDPCALPVAISDLRRTGGRYRTVGTHGHDLDRSLRKPRAGRKAQRPARARHARATCSIDVASGYRRRSDATTGLASRLARSPAPTRIPRHVRPGRLAHAPRTRFVQIPAASRAAPHRARRRAQSPVPAMVRSTQGGDSHARTSRTSSFRFVVRRPQPSSTHYDAPGPRGCGANPHPPRSARRGLSEASSWRTSALPPMRGRRVSVPHASFRRACTVRQSDDVLGYRVAKDVSRGPDDPWLRDARIEGAC
jgi:hypothetical protein